MKPRYYSLVHFDPTKKITHIFISLSLSFFLSFFLFSIDWQHTEEVYLDLDEYETSKSPPRTSSQMVLPRAHREAMLKKNWGVKQTQIAHAVRQNLKVKNQRRTTVMNLGRYEQAEIAAENMKRTFTSDIDKEVAALEAQRLEVERIRRTMETQRMMGESSNDSSE